MSKYTKPKPKDARPKRKRAARPSGPHGGYRQPRPGKKLGRPLSARGKLKQLRNAERLEVIAVLGTPDDPKEFLKAVMKSAEFEFGVRFEAACSLMPYYHQKLSHRTLTGPDGGPIKIAWTETEIVRRIADLLRLS